jgi:glyoxylase-like metal-dependent hydrolase (beta-lactamase superfamily II)
MKNIRIIQKRIGYSNATLIVNGEKSILVDTGVKGNMKQIRTLFKQAQLKFSDLQLIILTHTHYDHTGNLQAIHNWTGAKVMVHKEEFENLSNGFTPIPAGTRKYPKFISRAGRLIIPKFASPNPFNAEIVIENEFDLNEFGLDAKVIHTPGHTKGSQSVIIGKTAITGDAFVNMRNGWIFPPFADEPKVLLQTWQMLFDMNIKEIYPGHGPKLKVEKAMPQFYEWKEKAVSKKDTAGN